MVRCKMQLTEMTIYPNTRKYTFQPNYDTTIPEDQRFAKASPSGKFEIMVDNPTVWPLYEVGNFYYFDSTPVPVPATTT